MTRTAEIGPVEDFVTVQQAVTSPFVKSLQRRIFEGSATDDEIVQHYRTFDAIDSQVAFKNERARYLQLRAMGRVALADFIGGAQIVTSAIMRGLIEENDGYDGILDTLITEDSMDFAQQQFDEGKITERDITNYNVLQDYAAHAPNGPLKNLAERVG